MAHRRTNRLRRARGRKSGLTGHPSSRDATSANHIDGLDTASNPNTANPTDLAEAVPNRTIPTSRGTRRATDRTTTGNLRHVRPMRKRNPDETMANEPEVHRSPGPRRSPICHHVRPSAGHGQEDPRPGRSTKTTNQVQTRRTRRPNFAASGVPQTRSKIVRSIFTLLLICFPSSLSHQVVFDEIGHLAAAASYVHVGIPLRFSDLVHSANRFKELLQARYDDAVNRTADADPYYITPTIANDLAIRDVTAEHLKQVNKVIARIDSVQYLFPSSTSNTFSSVAQRDMGSRDRRFAGIGLIGTVVSSITGLYNREQLRTLRHQMKTVLSDQKRAFAILDQHNLAIQQLHSALSHFQNLVDSALRHSPAILNSEVLSILENFEQAIDIIVQTLQQAQNHQMAIEFLDRPTLEDTFRRCQHLASEHHARLIPEQPADLLQVETYRSNPPRPHDPRQHPLPVSSTPPLPHPFGKQSLPDSGRVS